MIRRCDWSACKLASRRQCVLSRWQSLEVAEWDHVTEASLTIESGILRVIVCLELTGEEFELGPGTYRVRCCHANLVESDETGEEGGDWYLVQVWPSPDSPPRILKRWQSAA